MLPLITLNFSYGLAWELPYFRVLGNRFGGKKSNNEIETLIQENVQNLVDKAGFEVQFEIRTEKEDEGAVQIFVEFSGPDEELFKDGDEWTIDKHRKKLMDWLTANRQLF